MLWSSAAFSNRSRVQEYFNFKMDENSDKIAFRIYDFLAFSVLFGLSCLIGIYFGYKDRRSTSTDNYFFGGRTMHPITVGMSMAVTFHSAVGLISIPAECYIVGNMCIWNPIIRILPAIISVFYFIPAFFQLHARTTYEFLELRFNARLRQVAAAMGIISQIFYAGVVVYVPAVALNSVMPIPLNWSIVLTTVACTFYTTLGGMKAVIWTDALQLFFMVIGVAAIAVQGLIVIGGFGNLFAALERGERYTAFRFDYGLIARASPVAKILGMFTRFLLMTGLSQQFIQRCQSCKTTRHAQYALLMYLIPSSMLAFTLAGTGMIVYAYYEGCDPVFSGKISSIDQTMPYLALELFVNLPGMAGIFVAAIFSASLSTISSLLNSYSMVIVEDILVPYWKRLAQSERLRLFVGKIAVIILGAFLLIIAFLASWSRSNILQLLEGFSGIFNGPLVGIFILGFFFPWTNSLGATIGLLSSFGLGLFMFICNEFLKVTYPSNIPPRYTDQCVTNTTTQPILDETTEAPENLATAIPEIERSTFQDFCNLNFNAFSFIGMLVSILIGLLVSFLSGPNKPCEVDPKLFIPLVDNSYFPKSIRKFFRFGVSEGIDKTENDADRPLQEDRL